MGKKETPPPVGSIILMNLILAFYSKYGVEGCEMLGRIGCNSSILMPSYPAEQPKSRRPSLHQKTGRLLSRLHFKKDCNIQVPYVKMISDVRRSYLKGYEYKIVYVIEKKYCMVFLTMMGLES
jgi:hypothetical protein